MSVATGTTVEELEVFARTIPTDEPESDGTLEWDSTTIVVVQAHAGGKVGLGYTYTHDAAARLIEDKLAPLVRGRDVDEVEAVWEELGRQLRNIGRPGIGFMALSAVDITLWGLKARLQERPPVELLGARREEAAIYGSGGFTSYSLERLQSQLAGWVEAGIPRVKIKVGRAPQDDPRRLDVAREAIGAQTELYVDANGAFDHEDALSWAQRTARRRRAHTFAAQCHASDTSSTSTTTCGSSACCSTACSCPRTVHCILIGRGPATVWNRSDEAQRARARAARRSGEAGSARSDTARRFGGRRRPLAGARAAPLDRSGSSLHGRRPGPLFHRRLELPAAADRRRHPALRRRRRRDRARLSRARRAPPAARRRHEPRGPVVQRGGHPRLLEVPEPHPRDRRRPQARARATGPDPRPP